MSLFIIKWNLYPFDIIVSIGWTVKKSTKELKDFWVEEEIIENLLENWPQWRTIMDLESWVTFLRLKHIPKCPKSISYLTHEVTHATQFLMERIWTPLSPDTYESYAYHTQYIVYEILKSLKK